MPTFETLPRFERDWKNLTRQQPATFRKDNDGRATFSYGQERIAGQAHVIWRRIGTHAIFTPARSRAAKPG